MSQGNLGVAEIQEREAVPQIIRKRKVGFSFLARAIVLVALAAIGVVMRSPLTQTSDLWRLTRFLTSHPMKDPYGVIETPYTAGLISVQKTTDSLHTNRDLTCIAEWHVWKHLFFFAVFACFLC